MSDDITRRTAQADQRCIHCGVLQKHRVCDACSKCPTYADVAWLALHCDDLADARHRGTPRAWIEPPKWQADKRAEADALASAERREKSPMAPGEHPAPLHVDVLDVMVDVLAIADDLAEQTAQLVGVERLPPAPSAVASAEPYLRLILTHLAAVAEADEGLLEEIALQAGRLRREVTAAIGDNVGSGQRMSCPWCRGGPERDRTLVLRDSGHGEALIVCESGVCEPGDDNVGAWHRGLPAWPYRWWSWMKDYMDRVEEHERSGAA